MDTERVEDGDDKPKRSCNRHGDCDAAEQEVMTRRGITRDRISYTFHCHSEDCEDCVGC